MKKILGSVASVSLMASPILTQVQVTEVLNKNKDLYVEENSSLIENYAVVDTWNIVSPHTSINLSVQTKKTGTQSKSDNASVSTTARLSYDQLKGITNINIYGEFKFGTKTEPKTLTNIALTQDLDVNKDEKLKFSYKYSHDKWKGWGHHTSEIAITVTITKSIMNMATIQIDNYVYARTAGAVNACSTKSTINKLEMIL